MATLTFTYETSNVPLSRIVDAFASQHNYQATINGSPNPETKSQFARRIVREYIVRTVQAQEAEAAIQAARDAVTSIALT